MDDRNTAFELLKELLGTETALRVAESFAGTALYIPKSVITAERHRMIRKEFREGATYRELSIRYGYSDTHIRAICRTKRGSNAANQG